MFTGIIQTIGTVAALQPKDGDVSLFIRASDWDWSDVALGDSIASNGICLTAVKLTGDGFWADASVETLNLTTLKNWRLGQAINLEKALTPQTRLGGHLVSGHVDGLGQVVKRSSDARSERFTLQAPKELAKYIAHKGSITVDGVSLTVNAVNGCEFELNIVPHTLTHTVMGTYQVGHWVNLEVDVIARYLERLLLGERAAEGTSALTAEFLAQNGYWK
jgi:riboflavin synthase